MSGSWTISIIWECVRNASFQPPPEPYRIRPLGMGQQSELMSFFRKQKKESFTNKAALVGVTFAMNVCGQKAGNKQRPWTQTCPKMIWPESLSHPECQPFESILKGKGREWQSTRKIFLEEHLNTLARWTKTANFIDFPATPGIRVVCQLLLAHSPQKIFPSPNINYPNANRVNI